MKRRAWRASVAFFLAVQALPARAPAQSAPALTKYGKWVAVAAAVGMGLEAASAHRAADRSFGQLRDYCDADQARCAVGAGGAYVDPVSERYYQASLAHDRSARAWLVGGEATLLGAAAVFVWELTRPKGPPDNIPFEPQLSQVDGQTRVGVRLWY
jgi:hypothetical protein